MEQSVREVLKTYWNRVEENHRLIGLMLYGDQNYHLETETSDINAYAVILPSRQDAVFGRPVNRKIWLKNGEIKVKDLRLFASDLLKGDYSALELLVTPYKIMKSEYWGSFKAPFVEDLLNYDKRKTIKSMFTQIEWKKQVIKDKPERAQTELISILHLQWMLHNLFLHRWTTYEYKHALWGSSDFSKPSDRNFQAIQAFIKVSLNKEDMEDIYQAMEKEEQQIKTEYNDWLNRIYPVDEKQQEEIREHLAAWVETAFVTDLFQKKSNFWNVAESLVW